MLFNSISKKVLAGYAIILIVSATHIIYQQANSIKLHSDNFVAGTLPALQHIEDSFTTLNEMQISAFALYGFTIDKETFAKQFAQHQQRIEQHASNLSRYASAMSTPIKIYL